MENVNNTENNKTDSIELIGFSAVRIVLGILFAGALLWGLVVGLEYLTKYYSLHKAESIIKNEVQSEAENQTIFHAIPKQTVTNDSHAKPNEINEQITQNMPIEHTNKETASAKEISSTHQTFAEKSGETNVTGVAFVNAAIKPLKYELKQRFWGWRPNDILNFTDNINNFQLGVLEVTRRTSAILAERVSRTGSTASFDTDLEHAMSWFGVKPEDYWIPSPESKYSAGLEGFETYREKLIKGEAKFYTRADNLIPLLAAFEDLLGSCDENLVKEEEEGGIPVSFFKIDDYFYYAQGIASAMSTILEAVLIDFRVTLQSRNSVEILHHAIEACQRGTKIHPWIVTDASLSSIFANHRANMAAPISHARFYLGLLIKALSI